MNIVVVGAGAVGCYYGVRLALAGHRVGFLVRSEASAATLRSGIRVNSDPGNMHLKDPIAFTDANQAAPVDLVLIAVKLWDTDSAVRNVLPVVSHQTSVISLQNGVDKDEMIAGVLGRDHLLGAVTYIVVDKAGDGMIVHSGTLQRIIIGELNGETTTRVREIVDALAAGGIDAQSSTDIRRSTWEKFIFLSSISAVTAVTRQQIGAARSHHATRTLLEDAMKEAAALARAEDVPIGSDFVADRMRFVDTLPAEGRSSMANDLLRGSRLELEWLSGAVVRRAARIGMPTPVHGALYAALVHAADGQPSQRSS